MRTAKKVRGSVVSVALTAESLRTSRPVIGAPLLGVGDVAERLNILAPDTSASIERIRHWTREGLLLPDDQHHAGTGKHRRYSANVAYDAAILTALADAGMHIVSRPYIRTALAKARAALSDWLKNPTRSLFLVIVHPLGPMFEPTADVCSSVKHDPSAKLTIVIDLAQLYARVQRV